MIDGECRKPRPIGIPKLERRVAVSSLSKGFDHGVIGLLRGPTYLVVHNVNQAAGLMLKEPKAFGVVSTEHGGCDGQFLQPCALEGGARKDFSG